MTKQRITIMLCAVLFCAALGIYAPLKSSVLETERRLASAFPEFPHGISSGKIKKFCAGIDRFYADHFPLRSTILSAASVIFAYTGNHYDTSRCYQGKSNWLFLGNDYSKCVDKLTGKESLNENQIERMAAKYSRLQRLVDSGASQFLILIGPNKSTIYGEHLPGFIFPSRVRYISPLVAKLRAMNIDVYDPTERLMSFKSNRLLYYRTDTHWNLLGAYVAFEGLREYAKWPPLFPATFKNVPSKHGDLVNIGGYTSFHIIDDDTFSLNDFHIQSSPSQDDTITTVQASSDKAVWVFGDSFTEALKPFIQAQFRTVRYFKHDDFKKVMKSDAPRPDIVLWVVVERNFAE